jgi:hypothetical protein
MDESERFRKIMEYSKFERTANTQQGIFESKPLALDSPAPLPYKNFAQIYSICHFVQLMSTSKPKN